MTDPLSIAQWFDQLRSVDPMNLMRRSAIPFVETESSYFAIFAPLLWIGAALACMIGGSLRKAEIEARLPFFLICAGLVAVSLFAPDELRFSSSTGGQFRERIFLSGLLFAVPVFSLDPLRKSVRMVCAALLSFVIAFQTFALWEYAFRSDRDAREFLSVRDAIPSGSSLAAVTVEADAFRFMATPTTSMNNYTGIRRGVVVWDNYEFGHYLFPLKLRERKDQEFVRELTRVNVHYSNAVPSFSATRIAAIESILSTDENRIDTLVLWGRDPEVDKIAERSFPGGLIFENGRARVFRREKE